MIYHTITPRFKFLSQFVDDCVLYMNIYSNKKDTSDFPDTVAFDPVKMWQQKINQNVYQTSDTQNLVII